MEEEIAQERAQAATINTLMPGHQPVPQQEPSDSGYESASSLDSEKSSAAREFEAQPKEGAKPLKSALKPALRQPQARPRVTFAIEA